MFENVIEISSDDDVVMVSDDNDFTSTRNKSGFHHHEHSHCARSTLPSSKSHVHAEQRQDKHNSRRHIQKTKIGLSPLCENDKYKFTKAFPMSSTRKMPQETTIRSPKYKHWLKVGKSWSRVRKERHQDGCLQYLKMYPRHTPCIKSKHWDDSTSKTTIGKSASSTGIPFRDGAANKNLLLNLHMGDDDEDADSDSCSVIPSLCLMDDLPDLEETTCTVFHTNIVNVGNRAKNTDVIKSFSTGCISSDGPSIVKQCASVTALQSGGNIFDNLRRDISAVSGSVEVPSQIKLCERDSTPPNRSSKWIAHHIDINHVLYSDSSDLDSPVTVVKKMCLHPANKTLLTNLLKPSLMNLSEKPVDVALKKDSSKAIQDTQVSCTSDSSDLNSFSPSAKKLCLNKDKKAWLADLLKTSVRNVSLNLMNVINAESVRLDKCEAQQTLDQSSVCEGQLHVDPASTNQLEASSSSSRHFLDVLSPTIAIHGSDTHKANNSHSNKDNQVTTSSVTSSCKDDESHVRVIQRTLAAARHDSKLLNLPRVVLPQLTTCVSGAFDDSTTCTTGSFSDALISPHLSQSSISMIKCTFAEESHDYKLLHSPKVLMSHLAKKDFITNAACLLSDESPFLPLSTCTDNPHENPFFQLNTDESENIATRGNHKHQKQPDIPSKFIRRVIRLKHRPRTRHSSAQTASTELASYNRMIHVNEKLMFPSLQSRLAYPSNAFTHQTSHYFSTVQLNTIEACSEETGAEYLCILLDQILDFSESARPPRETRKQVFNECILKSDEIPQTFKAVDILEFIRQKFRADLDIEWSMIMTLIGKVTISKGYGDYMSSEVITSISALQVIISHMEQELCRKDLSLPVKMRATYAYKLLSCDYAYNNLKEIVSTLTSAVTNGVYKEGRDSNIDARMQQADREQGLHEENSIASHLPSQEVENLLPLLQRMLSLGILVSLNMVDCAKKLAKEIMHIFVYLPTFEQKCLLLKTIVSDMLLFKVTQYILENHFYNSMPCCADFPASIIDVAGSYYFCTPCSSPMTPPYTSTDDDDFAVGMVPQMEELVMLLHQITLAYVRCSQGKGYRSMRRRADLCSGDQNHYRLSAADMQALREWPKYMEQLRSHIDEVSGQITYNMESYLLQMDCLQDLGDGEAPNESPG